MWLNGAWGLRDQPGAGSVADWVVTVHMGHLPAPQPASPPARYAALCVGPWGGWLLLPLLSPLPHPVFNTLPWLLAPLFALMPSPPPTMALSSQSPGMAGREIWINEIPQTLVKGLIDLCCIG